MVSFDLLDPQQLCRQTTPSVRRVPDFYPIDSVNVLSQANPFPSVFRDARVVPVARGSSHDEGNRRNAILTEKCSTSMDTHCFVTVLYCLCS